MQYAVDIRRTKNNPLVQTKQQDNDPTTPRKHRTYIKTISNHKKTTTSTLQSPNYEHGWCFLKWRSRANYFKSYDVVIVFKYFQTQPNWQYLAIEKSWSTSLRAVSLTPMYRRWNDRKWLSPLIFATANRYSLTLAAEICRQWRPQIARFCALPMKLPLLFSYCATRGIFCS